MIAPAILINKRRVKLGTRIGRGGEGEVYDVAGDNVHAVKLYTVSDLVEREQKVEAMIRSDMARQAPQVAFPLSVVRDEGGRFAGFLMKKVLEHNPLHELYSPGSRKIHFPHADYRFLVRAAQNISRAVGSVHAIGCVIGDINQSSILVSRAATVALIDSDSFQVANGSDRFFCRVGVPEYTPPELQGVPLAKIPRTANHDAFGLAIVIFQLLFMGRHPFVGSVRRGDIPPLHQSIREFRFVYTEGRDVGMDQPPGTPALSDFPQVVGDAFEAAFGRPYRDLRPSAQHWIDILAALENSLVQCSYEKLHWYPAEASECLWCAMERELGATLFIPFVPAAERIVHPFDPGAGGFSLSAVWQQIASFPQITLQLSPLLPQTTVVPNKGPRFVRWRGGVYVAKLRRHYFEVEQQWLSAVDAWRTRTGIAAIEELLQELRAAKTSYENLVTEEKAQLDAYERERHERQLRAYLDNFEIRRAKITGVRPAEEAALASFGIETAGDIVENKILGVPGFGRNNSSWLLHWRKRLESEFVYDAKENDLDRQELARIRFAIENKASLLRRSLLSGRANLDSAANRVSAMVAIKDVELAKLYKLRMQLRADLEYLGIDLATLSALAANSSQLTLASMRARRTAPTTPLPPSSDAQAGSPIRSKVSCPRCGSPMVSRIAKHGRWAGRQYWGCSRYPSCKGTRS
jgi:DNA-binding helix-hairpin-helix protein with protein kinase domain